MAIPKISRHKSNIECQHRAILSQLPARLNLRQEQLATANSAVAAVDRLKERGANDIRLVCLIGAPEGVERMRGIHPDVPIWLAAIDKGLDENAYILPGLGDAGDRAYGTK
jgi:uracil phosphoribosyltransferase